MNQNMQNPVEYDEKCAFAVSTGKTNVADGKHYAIINGKKYVFSNVVAKILFKLLPNRIRKADEVWSKR